jgi:hypothetical protein
MALEQATASVPNVSREQLADDESEHASKMHL